MRKGKVCGPSPPAKSITVHQDSTINQEESVQNDFLFNTMIKYNLQHHQLFVFLFAFVVAVFYVL
jgi:hypothetical protein